MPRRRSPRTGFKDGILGTRILWAVFTTCSSRRSSNAVDVRPQGMCCSKGRHSIQFLDYGLFRRLQFLQKLSWRHLNSKFVQIFQLDAGIFFSEKPLLARRRKAKAKSGRRDPVFRAGLFSRDTLTSRRSTVLIKRTGSEIRPPNIETKER